jgi:hypothetical protein
VEARNAATIAGEVTQRGRRGRARRSPCLCNRETNRTESGDQDRKSPTVEAAPSSRGIHRALQSRLEGRPGTVRCSEAERDANKGGEKYSAEPKKIRRKKRESNHELYRNHLTANRTAITIPITIPEKGSHRNHQTRRTRNRKKRSG